ncbi:MAG: hypothetical protein JXA69_12670 [Phycisphaerae bacterium]|nr:hypothetical protein [Phycisphaerae bacterium]
MPNETYIPLSVQFNGRALPDGYMCVLYESDGPQRRGSLTIPSPPQAGERGVLRFVGSRDGRMWDVSLGEVVIVADSAIGCEFVAVGPIRIVPIETPRPDKAHDDIDHPEVPDRMPDSPRGADDSRPAR